MIAQVEVAGVKVTVVQHNEYGVVALELAQIFAASVIIETEDITVKPYLTSAECGTAFLFQGYLVYRQAGQDNSLCLSSLDTDLTKVTLEDDTPHTRIRF